MDTFYIVYFIVHFFISILIDSAIALPESLTLPLQKTLLQTQITQNHDFLLVEKPVWLQTFVWVEIILQVPFFAWAAYALAKKNKKAYIACLIYGVEASTTTLGCLGEVAMCSLDFKLKAKLFAIYFPTFLIPLYMTYDFGTRLYRIVGEKSKIK